MRFNHLLDPVSKLFLDAWEYKALASALVSFIGFFLPSEQLRSMALGAFTLVILDTLSGAAVAIKKGVPFSSGKFSRVLSKLMLYSAVVGGSAVVTRFVPGMSDYQQIGVVAVLTFVMITELISIFENAAAYGLKLPKGILSALQGRLKSDAGKETT